jgi:hypothetical protein
VVGVSAPTPGWQPLPECIGCERPTRRRTWRSNGGYCTTCRPLGASPVQALPDAGRSGVDLAEWQALVADRGRAEREASQRRRRRR